VENVAKLIFNDSEVRWRCKLSGKLDAIRIVFEMWNSSLVDTQLES